jgi:hypothetical protein
VESCSSVFVVMMNNTQGSLMDSMFLKCISTLLQGLSFITKNGEGGACIITRFDFRKNEK